MEKCLELERVFKVTLPPLQKPSLGHHSVDDDGDGGVHAGQRCLLRCAYPRGDAVLGGGGDGACVCLCVYWGRGMKMGGELRFCECVCLGSFFVCVCERMRAVVCVSSYHSYTLKLGPLNETLSKLSMP